LIVLENKSKNIIGTLQLSFIQYLTYQGGLRAQIESVRIQKEFRGKGFGKKIFKWAINRSIEKGAHLIQLTTDNQRPDAIEFYKSLGFIDSHLGMKLHL
jgi:GNAT superfamily N-acetyltransferase